jgi:hypothetical protein
LWEGEFWVSGDTQHDLRLKNGSRIISLPCNEHTIRGHSGVHLVIIDEAAQVPEDIFTAVSPMLASTNGRLICLSTPFGKRGYFYRAWKFGGSDWHRIEITADKVSHLSKEYLERERRTMSAAKYRQEYCCEFGMLAGLVYPDFAKQVSFGRKQDERVAIAHGKKVGGIDFGFSDPFVALWGVLDHNNVLWLTGEHYCRQKPLSYHAEQIPKEVTWWADPSEPGLISEMRCAGFKVSKSSNPIDPGNAAVASRLENHLLRVCDGCCPNLLHEAELYRYGEAVGDKPVKPVDEYNHTLDALRYLVMKLDAHHLARPWYKRRLPSHVPADPAGKGGKRPKWLSIYNERLWTPVATIYR